VKHKKEITSTGTDILHTETQLYMD